MTTPPPLSGLPIQPLAVIRCAGTQPAMGRQHAELLRRAGGFDATLEFYPSMVARLISSGLPPRLRGKWTETVGALASWPAYARLQQSRPAEYLDRSRAFFAGLGLSASEARQVLVMDVFQNTIGLLGRTPVLENTARAAVSGGCSSLVVWGGASSDGKLRHGRNLDLPGVGVWDHAPAVVFCSPERGLRYGFATTRGADIPGATCFNEAGITLGAHTRFHQDVRFRGAAITDLGHAIIQEARSIDDAVRVARRFPPASSWGLCISSAEEQRAVVIEATGQAIEVVEPEPGEDFIACANHYVGEETVRGAVYPSPCYDTHSRARAGRLIELAHIATEARGMSGPELAIALGDMLDPADPSQPRAAGNTVVQPIQVATVLNEPDDQTLRLAVGPTPTAWGPWASIPWRWSDQPELELVEPDAEGSVWSARRFPGAANQSEAHAHYVEACRLHLFDDVDAVRRHLDRAAELAPDEPHLRFLAGGVALQRGTFERAQQHFEAALHTQQSPHRRGQALLWAARAAAASGDEHRAAQHRAELLRLDGDDLDLFKREARSEQRRARPKVALRLVVVNPMTVDLV